MEDFKQKVRGCIIGHTVADALGVPVEFKSREYLNENPLTDMMGYGTHCVPKGTWSDDTSMTLATLDGLSDGIDYDGTMRNFDKWLSNAEYTATGLVFDAGITSVNSIHAYKYDSKKPIDCGGNKEYDNGNGSLMRIHPIVLYLYGQSASIEEKLEIIFNYSRLTHAHRRSLLACGIYAFVLWEILENTSIQGVIDGLYKGAEYFCGDIEFDYFKRVFDPNFYNSKVDAVKSSGYVVDTLEAALWCVINTKTYEECILKAVNLGSDTDTVGAIAGGLAGVIYGEENIPKKWKDNLIKRDYIEKLIDKVF
jgi:ADP-ribosylglycohydrolase